MTKEEKQLLLKDLCARLPYGVICKVVSNDNPWIGDCKLRSYWLDRVTDICYEIKPYLRPMSSMTSKEWIEYCDACVKDDISWTWAGKEYKFTPVTHREEFLNSHYLDFRGLIPMGLALEAPEGMYN